MSSVSGLLCLMSGRLPGFGYHQTAYIALSALRYNEAMYPDPTKVKMGLASRKLRHWSCLLSFSKRGLRKSQWACETGLQTNLCTCRSFNSIVYLSKMARCCCYVPGMAPPPTLSPQGEICWRVSRSQGRQQWLSETVNWQDTVVALASCPHPSIPSSAHTEGSAVLA